MKNKKPIFFLIGTLILLFGSIFSFLPRGNGNSSNSKDIYQPEEYDYSEYLTLKKRLENESETKVISQATLIDTSFKNVDLKTIGKNGPVLIFNFPSKGCQLCAKNEIKRLALIKDRNKSLNIILVSDFQTAREFKLFDKWHKSGLNWFNSMGKKFDLPIEKLKIPFYFVLDNKGDTEMVFAPLKEFPEDTDKYLSSIPFLRK